LRNISGLGSESNSRRTERRKGDEKKAREENAGPHGHPERLVLGEKGKRIGIGERGRVRTTKRRRSVSENQESSTIPRKLGERAGRLNLAGSSPNWHMLKNGPKKKKKTARGTSKEKSRLDRIDVP